MPAKQNASEKLAQYKDHILAEWESLARLQSTSIRKMERAQLRNGLPQVLDVMIATLRDPGPAKSLYVKEKLLALNHGKVRAEELHYSLDQMIEEYHFLQQVIFEFLDKDGQQLNRVEQNLILDVINISIRNAATEFKTVQDQQKANVQENLNRANRALQNALGEKSSEAVLKDQLLKTVFERVEDYALFSLDPDGNIASWSYGCHKIKQYVAEEVIGNHYSMLYPPEGRVRNEPMTHLGIAQRQGRFRGEGLRMRKNGDLFLADVFITPMYEKDVLLGYFKIVTDLSERNKLIQEMDMSRTQVETLTLESELRDRFIYMLSHDLRTPLATAHGSAELIARTPCSDPMHRDVAHRIVRQSRRVDDMITNLLDASRIREGEPFPLTLSEFDLTQLAREVCEDLSTRVGDRFKVDALVNLIGYWDMSAMRRVIENLAANAIKYGDPDGNVTISLSAAESRVLVKVHNFGSPISTEDQESLFELFRRADSAQRGSKTGWGLGLTLVRGITEAHGGIVNVRSLPVEGTTFIVDVPRDSRIHPQT